MHEEPQLLRPEARGEHQERGDAGQVQEDTEWGQVLLLHQDPVCQATCGEPEVCPPRACPTLAGGSGCIQALPQASAEQLCDRYYKTHNIL